jgi:site-specific DNA-methyltransferase (adenine-specific)
MENTMTNTENMTNVENTMTNVENTMTNVENTMTNPNPKRKIKLNIIDNDTHNNSTNTTNTTSNVIDIKNIEGLTYLLSIPNNSIDLILTDPPYIISKDSGMNDHYNNVKNNEENNINTVKTEQDWDIYKRENNITDDENKDKYMKYGSIYGKKYCVKTDYGEWDSEFTMDILEKFISEYYKKLKKGGTLIIFFDLWKISYLKEVMEKYKFKQIRFIEWIKTNPQPRNSKINYLTNCREIALIGIKDSNPTFNSSYDNGIYNYPLQGGKHRFHPTQKSLLLFEDLIKKHSKENDTVLDTFLGAGTTAIACKNTNRKCKGCEISKEYYDKIMEIIETIETL